MKISTCFGIMFCSFLIMSCEEPVTEPVPPPGDESDQGQVPPPETSPDDESQAEEPNYCGKLSFEGVEWPLTLNSDDRMAVRLALNITGSFEGQQGWTNLSNNFDGQGFSLGLLQQNLGQGSLQPLLISMRNRHKSLLLQVYGQARMDSLLDMLATWETQASGALSQKFSSENEMETNEENNSGLLKNEQELFSTDEALSPLDREFVSTEKMTMHEDSFFAFKNSASNTRNGKSVDWALANVFTDDGVTFKSVWKSALQTMANLPEYRSLQIEASLNLYRKAVQYYRYFKFRELRSILLMYDFVVQNGGFNTTHQAQYADFEKLNSQATETQKLKALLEIRLKSVNPVYMDDVRARKTTIIDGSGKVHGSTRVLQKEYCYQGTQSFSASPNP